MRKWNYIWMAALLLASCDKAEEIAVDDGSIRFVMQYPSATRATETSFEQGDKIGLFLTEYTGETPAPLQISGNWANNVAATLEGTEWVTAKKIFWSDNRMDAYGYYPYMSLTSVDEQPFSIALDQSTERTGDQLGGYEASDFLWAKTEGVDQSTETVTLQFSHRCSKLVIQLVKGPSYEGELPDSATVYIHNVVPTATIDLATGAVTKDIFGEVATVKARKVNNATYEAIMIPQRIESRRPFIEIVVNNISYLLEDTFQFKAGMQHTLSLVINSNPDQVSVDIGGEIVGGWN
ncbi:fimbrillin family protein [uncultured Barnesiella sp.]|uniref:fimbrillin family protein n=1 Tax=uncultured Barnesiella sp. TaxID=584861 RepID=UPI00260F0AEB|nr:fimbrillin family protein [uncultured Barnesiella sp.]